MNDTQLSYIIKLVETGSLNKVANHFNISYQSVSYQIESLEAELGITIFTRTKKGCVLTEEGSLVYQYARNTLNDYADLKQRIKKYKNVRIGVDNRYIPPFFLNFAYNVGISNLTFVPIDYQNVNKNLTLHNVDCYLGYERDFGNNTSFISLRTDSIGIAVSSSSPLTIKSVLEYSDLSNSNIHIGNFTWPRKDKVVSNILSYSQNVNIITEPLESLAIAQLYAGESMAIMPCAYSFIFNNKIKVIPLENETIEYGYAYIKEEERKVINLRESMLRYFEQTTDI